MDPSDIGNGLLGLALLASTLGQQLTRKTRQTRRKAAEYEARLFKAQALHDRSLVDRMAHNRAEHPDGVGAIEIFERVDLLTMEDADDA